MNQSYHKLLSLYNQALLDSHKDSYGSPLNYLQAPSTPLEKKMYTLQSLADVFEKANSFVNIISRLSHELTNPAATHEEFLSALDFSTSDMERISNKYINFIQSYFKFFLSTAILSSSKEDLDRKISNFFQNNDSSNITQETIFNALFGE